MLTPVHGWPLKMPRVPNALLAVCACWGVRAHEHRRATYRQQSHRLEDAAVEAYGKVTKPEKIDKESIRKVRWYRKGRDCIQGRRRL